MLTRDQVDSYIERGYTVVEGAVEGAMLDRARSIIDRLVANASAVSCSNDVYDIEESHSPAAPRVRRIKEPVELSVRRSKLVANVLPFDIPEIAHALPKLAPKLSRVGIADDQGTHDSNLRRLLGGPGARPERERRGRGRRKGC